MPVDQVGSKDDWVRMTNADDSAKSVDEVDMTVLNGFQEGQRVGEPDLIVELIDLYLRDAPERLDAIRAAAVKKNAILLNRAAHALKGSSASIGIRQIAEVCEELEQSDCEVAPERVEALVQLLAHKFARVRKVLAAERQRRFE